MDSAKILHFIHYAYLVRAASSHNVVNVVHRLHLTALTFQYWSIQAGPGRQFVLAPHVYCTTVQSSKNGTVQNKQWNCVEYFLWNIFQHYIKEGLGFLWIYQHIHVKWILSIFMVLWCSIEDVFDMRKSYQVVKWL